MINISDKEKCSGCSACYNICPVDAIRMSSDEEGFFYPTVDLKKCIKCNKCEKVCQYQEESILKQHEIEAYAAYNTEENVRWNSSSGGMFALFASEIIKEGGYVVGAAFDDTWMVQHKIIDDIADLPLLMGSKYVQSDLKKIFGQIKKLLDEKKVVMFAGTGCQVKGLKRYLGKEYDNLLCIDFICLGVPSPLIWREYKKTVLKDQDIRKINFKDKSLGWHKFSFKAEGSRTFCEEGRGNMFMNGYFRGYYTRPSCFNCTSKGLMKESDITLADCWGIDKINPKMDDNKGISAIVVHTEYGKKIWEKVKDGTVFCSINAGDILKYNKGTRVDKKHVFSRTAFWKAFNVLPYEIVFKLFCSPSLIWHLKKIKGMMIKK